MQKLKFIEFAQLILSAVPFLELQNTDKLIQNYNKYLRDIPVYGTIILNKTRTKILLGTQKYFYIIWELINN